VLDTFTCPDLATFVRVVNGRLEHLRGSALGFCNLTPTTSPDHSWKPAASDPDYTLHCEACLGETGASSRQGRFGPLVGRARWGSGRLERLTGAELLRMADAEWDEPESPPPSNQCQKACWSRRTRRPRGRRPRRGPLGCQEARDAIQAAA